MTKKNKTRIYPGDVYAAQANQWPDVSPPSGGVTRQQTATPAATPAPVGLRTRQLFPSAPEPNRAAPWWTALQSVMVQPYVQDSSTCRTNRDMASQVTARFLFFLFFTKYVSEQYVPPLCQLMPFPPGGTPEQEHGSTRHVTSCRLSQCSASCRHDVDGNEIRAHLWTRWNILRKETPGE